jgi:hypothetical protein
MPLDPIKLKYAELKVSDPAAARAFAKANGLPVEEMTPADKFKSDSLKGVRQMIGGEAPATGKMQKSPLPPGVMSITPLPARNPDMMDNVIEQARDAGHNMNNRDARMEAMKAALQQWANKAATSRGLAGDESVDREAQIRAGMSQGKMLTPEQEESLIREQEMRMGKPPRR